MYFYQNYKRQGTETKHVGISITDPNLGEWLNKVLCIQLQ